MSTTLAAQAGRTTTKITVVSRVAHLPPPRSPRGDGRGLRAVLRPRAGRDAARLGVGDRRPDGLEPRRRGARVSLGVLAWTPTGDYLLGVVAIAIPLLFIDWVLYANAHRAIG